jgi:Mn-dependent DtxR family transcriptional regulator
MVSIECFRDNKSGKHWLSLRRFAIKPPVKPKHPNSLAAQARSESTEDHLERIQELVDQKGYARVADIAASLALSTSAVSNMVRRLAARGYVNYEKYRGLTLTSEGQAVANHIKVRHQTLTALLQLLGLGPQTVQEEVEVIEHHLKPETLRVFSKLVQFWLSHPKQLREFLDYSKRR